MSDYIAENQPLAPNYQAPAEEPVAEETESWQGPSREEWEQTQTLLQQAAESHQTMQWLAEQAQQLQQQGQGEIRIDPFADDFQQQLDAYIAQRVQPYEQLRQDVTLGEAEERAQDILHNLQQNNGEFLRPESEKMARSMSDAFMMEEVQRHGHTPRAAEAALERAYNYVREYENGLAQTALERHANQIARLDAAPREPGQSAPPAVQTQGVQAGGDEMSVVRHFGGFGPGGPGR